MRVLLFTFITTIAFAQTQKLDTVFCDCNVAKAITIISKTMVGKTIAPNGYGLLKEINPQKQYTKFSFEKEHNTAWYKLIIKATGKLSFDIKPIKFDDDYDFMLFKGGRNFCDSLLHHKISPVRACISRDKKELNGETGLSHKASEELISQGIAAAYVKPIEVIKGEIYYLVLDNVYEKGEGHSIEFNISQDVTINGIITDELKKPVKTEIALTNQKGDTLLIENSKDDGTYNFVAPIINNQSYTLNFYNDSSFTYSKAFTLAEAPQLKHLSTILAKLKKGTKYSVGAINFKGGLPDYIPQAIPPINNLYRLMKKNPKLKIEIIGHVNGCVKGGQYDSQKLSELRAETIKNVLVLKGIDSERIKTAGKGCKEMLYKDPRNPDEERQNRRVEILVLEY